MKFEGNPGDWIKKRRMELGLTQNKLAQAIKRSTEQVGKIESGQSSAIKVLPDLAIALKIPEEYREDFGKFITSTKIKKKRSGRSVESIYLDLEGERPEEYHQNDSRPTESPDKATESKSFFELSKEEESLDVFDKPLIEKTPLKLKRFYLVFLLLFVLQSSSLWKNTYKYEVFAQAGYQKVNLNFRKGDRVEFRSNGSITLDKENVFPRYVDCNGYISYGKPETFSWAEMQTEPVGILIGRWGEDRGTLFGIGCGKTISVSRDGNLFLRINDSDEIGDNDGSIVVEIIVSR